jgi:hypothetical protein
MSDALFADAGDNRNLAITVFFLIHWRYKKNLVSLILNVPVMFENFHLCGSETVCFVCGSGSITLDVVPDPVPVPTTL